MIKNDEIINKAGVYAMYKLNNKSEKEYLYIGSSIEINDRYTGHKSNLKSGKYAGTTKDILQKEYDKNNLYFEIVREVQTVKVKDLNSVEKNMLFRVLSTLEEFYIECFKDTICNKQNTVKQHSTANRELRSKANKGSNNPNSKYDKKIIQEIIWLKENTELKHREIANFIRDIYNIEIREVYVAQVGKFRWIGVEGIKPNYIELEEMIG